MEKIKYLCPSCKKITELSTKPKRSFMGFPKITCINCKKEFRYPLTAGYVTAYWILLLANLIWVMSILLQGGVLIPNPIGIVVLIYVIVSLIKSRTLSQQIVKLQNSVPEYCGTQGENGMTETHNCLHCGTQGVLLMSDGRCPNCKNPIIE